MLSREILLIGEKNTSELSKKKVAVFGVGGVGGFCVEALARSGIGEIAVIDADIIDKSNVNRQIIALSNNVGKNKTDIIKERILSINPNLRVKDYKLFYSKETADKIDLKNFDYVIDAIDTVSAKIELIVRCKRLGVKIISCMGTGGKIDITKLRVGNIKETSVCPLAKVMRKELKTREIDDLKVVYSIELPIKRDGKEKAGQPSMIFVPATAGLMLAKEVIFDLISK